VQLIIYKVNIQQLIIYKVNIQQLIHTITLLFYGKTVKMIRIIT